MVPCFEGPARADDVLAELQRRAWSPVQAPRTFDDGALSAVHSQRYLDFLAHAWDEWVALDPAHAQRDVLASVWPTRSFRTDLVPHSFAARMGLYSFDAGTPLTRGSWKAAHAAASCALSAAQQVLGSDRAAFALTRPPGHHAGPDFFGGYCFLNNAAIAAQALRRAGLKKVAVLDVDYHHGNGTQTIFYERADVFFASVHGDPHTEYPFFLGHADERGAGSGLGCNLNLPLPRGASVQDWFSALDHALAAISAFQTEALVVSLGMDTYANDPICGFRLQTSDYLRLGERLARAALPTVLVFEGGYAVDALGQNTVNVLEAFR